MDPVEDRPARPFVSVKRGPADRFASYSLPDGASLQDFPPGATVVVQTEDGRAIGTVTPIPSALAARRAPASGSPLQVVRRANREDLATRLHQQQRELEAYRVGLMKIRERGLAMKLTRVEQKFDGSKLVFYYTADGRIDFRELVRELAAHFRTRIEMRQIGVRDEAKMIGGYGPCGRPLCCSTWLKGFAPVSIKMAKQQQLSLNPSKLSGQCGRLKCCLRYELGDGRGQTAGGCGDEGDAARGAGAAPARASGGCASGGCGSGGCGCGAAGAGQA
jgi:cell fate regulator YaaT (PSP1 superfamily)